MKNEKMNVFLLIIMLLTISTMTACGRLPVIQAGGDQSPTPSISQSAAEPSATQTVSPEASDTPAPTAATETPEPTPMPLDSHIDDFPGLPYAITEMNDTEGNIDIRYPKLSGVGDSQLDDKINQLVEADAKKLAAALKAENGTLDVDFEIAMAGKKILSIKYIVYSNVPGAAHPSHSFYTTNIYLTMAAIIKLDDLIRVSDYLASAFTKNCRYAGPLPGGDKALENSLQEYLNAVNGASLALADTESDSNACFSYFTPDSLGISVETPFALGGYALYEAKYEDVISYIYSGNAMIDDFPGLKSKFFNAGNSENPRVIEDMFVDGWSTLAPGADLGIAEGDLDKDGNADVAYVLDKPGASGEPGERTLIVSFGPIFDSVAADARKAVLRADEGGIWGDPFDSIEIKNGCLYLHFYAGSNMRWAKDYQFRYQDGDFYLIGATKNDFDAITNEGTKVDYNLQTGEYITTVTDAAGKQTSTTGKADKRNKYRLSDFDPRSADVFDF